MGETVKSRMSFVDSCKALGIILVVLGHTYGIPNWMYNIIYAFHMPLFFIISGYLYNAEKYNGISFGALARKKAKSYIIPYFIFAFINLLLQIVYKLVFNRTLVDGGWLFHNIKGILLCYSDMENMPNCSPIWFLVCLFIATLIFRTIMKYANRFAPYLAVGCMLISYGMYMFLDVRIPWKLSTAFMAVFFMYLGYVFRKHNVVGRITDSKLSPLIMLVLLAVGCISGYFNGGNVGMNGNTYGNLLLFLIGAVGLSTVTFALFGKFPFLNNRFLVWLGRNTLYIMAFNYFMRDFTTELYYLVPVVRNFPIHWTVSFVLITLGCIAAVFVYKFSESTVKKIFAK